MRIKRRTLEINFETSRRVLVRRRSTTKALCPVCKREVQMSLRGAAATRVNVTHRALDRMLESGRLHSGRDGEGRILVCLISLAQVVGNT